MRTALSGTTSLHKMRTVPVLSSPLLPARPAIWMYSAGFNVLVSQPSNFLMESNTTVRAGMLTPMAKVSVAKRSYKNTDSLFQEKFFTIQKKTMQIFKKA